jgi:hypothetical protein
MTAFIYDMTRHHIPQHSNSHSYITSLSIKHFLLVCMQSKKQCFSIRPEILYSLCILVLSIYQVGGKEDTAKSPLDLSSRCSVPPKRRRQDVQPCYVAHIIEAHTKCITH